MFIPDKTSKTVHIPVRVKDGDIEYFYEDNTSFLKQISDGTIMEIIVPEYALKDKELAKKLSKENEVPILSKGTVLLADMNVKTVTNDMKPFIKKPKGFMPSYGFEIKLLEDLRLVLRGSKKAKLTSCKCEIPFLKKNAISLNHAYSLLSQKLETSRSSHSGSVFEKLFYQKNGRYEKFGVLRDTIESKEELVLEKAK